MRALRTPSVCVNKLVSMGGVYNTAHHAREMSLRELERLHERLHMLTAAPADEPYYVLYHSSMARFADTLKKYPRKFKIPEKPITWDLFSDGTDKIDIENSEQVAGKKVLFLANTESNSYFVAQLHVLNYLGCLRPGSLTIVLPFLTTGTMERIDTKEKDRVPTAVTTINMFNNLPQMGPPTLIITYDIHALQEQFYFHHPAVAGLRSAIPLLLKNLEMDITCVAFPDDGANKRFANSFPASWDKIVCTKTRAEGKSVVTVKNGDPKGKHVLIVDDQTKSGGTFFACIDGLLNLGASKVSAFVTHPVFNDRENPNHGGPLNPSYQRGMEPGQEFWGPFAKNYMQWGKKFGQFYVTNSIPSIYDRVEKFRINQRGSNRSPFVILDLAEQLAEDL
jgi:phosphoribosylpyrophosphate synthetase